MKDPVITPLPDKSNVAIVCERLEELIREGCWKADEKIFSEAELGARFNVGRSTVREALNMLKAKNLVYTIPGLGTFVRQEEAPAALRAYVPDPQSSADLLNVMELRLSLEPMNAAFAARRATAGLIAEMRERQNELLHSDKPDLFGESDLEFHMLIARATDNPLIVDSMNTVRAFLLKQQIFTSQAGWRRSQAGKFHDRILVAIERADDRAAEDIMREHMEDTYIYIKSLIGGDTGASGRWEPRIAGKEKRNM